MARIGFDCMLAGWKCRIYVFLKVVDKEYVLDDVTYQIDGSRGYIGKIDFKMTLNSKGQWNKKCKLILSEPYEKTVYPGDTGKTKTFTKINIPKESVYQIQSSLSDEYMNKHVICKN